jgi:hypothetical protein
VLPPTPKSTVKEDISSFETLIIFTNLTWYVISPPPPNIMNRYLLYDGNIVLTSNLFFARFL